MTDALPTELTGLMSIFKVNLVPRVLSYSSLQGKNPGERRENPGNEVVFKVKVLDHTVELEFDDCLNKETLLLT